MSPGNFASRNYPPEDGKLTEDFLSQAAKSLSALNLRAGAERAFIRPEDPHAMWPWMLAMTVVVGLAAILGCTSLVVAPAAIMKLLFLLLLAAFLIAVVMGVSRHA
jgi:uncharacterized membrane protein YtjA (UPF0391 family)